jgi:hypothetical protein
VTAGDSRDEKGRARFFALIPDQVSTELKTFPLPLLSNIFLSLHTKDSFISNFEANSDQCFQNLGGEWGL